MPREDLANLSFDDSNNKEDKNRELLLNLDFNIPNVEEQVRYDTTIGKNDAGFTPLVADPESLRARNQSGLDQAVTAIGGGAYKGLLTAVEDVGYILDFENNIKHLVGLEDITTNFASEWATEQKAKFDEEFPIYRKNSEDTFDLSDPGFYWQAVQGIVDSAVGFGITGAGVGGAISKAAKISRLASLIGKAATEAGVSLSSGYITNFAESKMMGLELYNNIMDGYEDKILLGEIDEKTVRRIAGEQADAFMLRNKMFMLTDAMSLHGMFRGGKFINDLDDKTKAAYKLSKGETLSLAERNPKLAGGLQDSVGEYLEETGQSVLQAEGDYQANKDLGEDVSGYSDSFIGRAIDKFATADTQLEGLMGFFGGGLQAGLAKLPSRLANKAADEQRREQQLSVIGETDAELDRILKPVIDKEKEKQNAEARGEVTMANHIRNELFTDTALRNFQAGTTEILEEKLDDVARLSKEEADNLGYEDNYAQEALRQKNRLQSLKKDYTRISNKFYEDKYAPLIPEIFKTKVEADQLIEDLGSVKSEIEQEKALIIDKVTKLEETATASHDIQIPILEDKIKSLTDLQRKLRSRRTRESKTPTGKISKNKRLVKRLEELYDPMLSEIDSEKENNINKLNQLKEDKKLVTEELDKVSNNIKFDDFSEFEVIKQLNQVEADIRGALALTQEKQAKLSTKAGLDEILERSDEIAKDLEAQAEKERKAKEAADKKAEDEAQIARDIQAKEDAKAVREEQKKANKEEKKERPKGFVKGNKPGMSQKEIAAQRGQEVSGSPENSGETVFTQEEMQAAALEAEQNRREEEERLRAEASASNQQKGLQKYDGPQELTSNETKEMLETVIDDFAQIEGDKIVEAASSVAYLSKEYEESEGRIRTISNELQAGLFKKNLSSLISRDTPVKLVVDTEYPGFAELSKDVDTIPIAIKVGDDIIGYVRDVNYITPARVVDIKNNIAEQKAKLRQIRQAIVNTKGQSVTTFISEKSIGHLSKDKDGKWATSSERIPHVTKFAIAGNDDQLYMGTSKLLDVSVVNNMDKLVPGAVYAVVETPNGKYMALPLKNKPAGEKVATALTEAFRIFYDRKNLLEDQKKVVDTIKNELELDITEASGLQEYYSLFVYKYNLNDKAAVANILATTDRKKRYINVGGNSVQFLTSGSKLYELSDNTPDVEVFLGRLKNHITGMYINMDLAKIENNDRITIPYIERQDGQLTTDRVTYNSYSDFIKEYTETNIVENDLGDGQYGYFDHPNIYFNTDFANNNKELTTPDKVDSGLVEPDKIETKKDTKKVSGKDISNAFGLDESDLSIGNIEAATDNIDIEDVLIPGFSSFKQNQVVDFLSKAFLAYKRDEKGRKKIGDVFTHLKSQIAQEPFVSDERFKEILDNWNKFEVLTVKKLSNIGIIRVNNPNNIDLEALADVESDFERSSFDDSWSFSISSKDNASGHLKEFLAFIADRDANGVVMNYLGLSVNKSYDSAFEELSALLAGVPNNWTAMREVLEEAKHDTPWLQSLLNKIDKAKDIDRERTKIGLVVAMSKAKQSMQTVLWEEKVETAWDHFSHRFEPIVDPKTNQFKRYYSLRIINTNQNSLTQVTTDRWIENLRTSPIIRMVDGNLAIDEASRKSLIKEIEKIAEDPNIEDAVAWLNKLGVRLSDTTIHKLKTRKIGGRFFKAQFKGHGIFELMRRRLEGRDEVASDEDKDLQKYNPLLNNSGIRALAREEGKANIGIYSNSYRDSSGNTIWGYGLNKALTHKFNRLINKEGYAERLYEIPFNSNSEIDGKPTYKNWIYRLAHDSYFKENFDIAPFDATKKANSTQEGVKVSNMSSKDLEVTSMSLFQNMGSGGKGGKIAKFLLTVPGKTTSYVITAPKHEIKFDKDTNYIYGSTRDALYSIAESEARRIYKFNRLTKEQKAKLPEQYRKNAHKFFLFPELNDIGIMNGKELLSENTVVNGKTVKEHIQDTIDDVVKREIEIKKADWRAEGIIEDNKVNFIDRGYENNLPTSAKENQETKVNYMVTDYVVNEMLARMGMHQAFIGDPAFFAKGDYDTTFDNIAKRLAKLIAPGQDLAQEGENDQFTLIQLADREVASKNIDQLVSRLKEKSNAYKEITTTDAQGISTAKEYLKVAYQQDKLPTAIYNSILAKIEQNPDNYTLTSEEMMAVVPTKPVYSETQIDRELGIANEVYVKLSTIPLFPELTKGTPLDKLRKKMEKIENDNNTTVLATYKSAIKLGGVKYAEVFDENGDVKDDIDLTSYAIVLDRSGYRIQQELPYDSNKTESPRGSQETKLVLESILGLKGFKYKNKEYDGAALRRLYYDKFRDLFQRNLDDLENDLWKEDENALDIPKLRQILLDEAYNRKFSNNQLAYLNLGEDNDFAIPLWLGSAANSYESMLLSLVTNRVIKRKTRGKSYVLVSETGFQGKSEGITTTKSYDPEKGLLPSRVIKNEDGTETVLGSQIFVPWDFRDNEGNLLDINKFKDGEGNIDFEKLPKELLESFGYRIPTQSHSSMGLMEIVGFITEPYKDTVIASQDLVAQMGSDFDIDKLYTYMYNTYLTESGSLRRLDSFQVSNIEKDIKEIEESFSGAGVTKDNIKAALSSFREALRQKKSEIAQYRDYLKETGVPYAKRKELLEEANINLDLFKNKESDLERWLSLTTVLDSAEISILQNDILELHGAIMKHPSVFNKSMKPLDFGDLKTDIDRKTGEQQGVAFDIERLRNKRLGKSKVSYLTSNYWKKKYLESIDGAQGISVKALDSTFNAIVQQDDPSNNLHLLTVRNKEIVNDYIVFGGDNYKRIERGDLSDPYTEDGTLKSETHSAYLSAAVDNEKDPILGRINSNIHTFAVERALAQVGFNQTRIAYFTSQPAIESLVRRLKQLSGTTSNFVADAKETTVRELKNSLLDAFKESVSTEKYEEFLKIADDPNYPLTLQDMKGSIEKGNAYKGRYLNYHQIQILALNKFLKADAIGNNIGKLQRAVNSDSKGAGKSFLESEQKEQDIRDIALNMPISNVQRLIGDYTAEGIIPQTINGFASVYGTMAANRIFNPKDGNKLYPYSDIGISETFKELEEIAGKKLTTDEKRDIVNNIKSFLYTKSEYGVGTASERERLFIDTKENKSVATRVQEFAETPEGFNNPFINRLSTKIKQGGVRPSRLEYKASKAENRDELNIDQGFVDLLRNHTDLAIDIIKAGYLEGGVQGSRNYIKYIPTSYLLKYGFAAASRNTNLNDEKTLGTVIEGGLDKIGKIGSFTLQYLQHNPNLAPKLSDDLKEIIPLKGKGRSLKVFKINPSLSESLNILRKIEGEERIALSEVYTQFNPSSPKNYNLFRLSDINEDGEYIYTKIDTLGEDFFNEYNGEIGEGEIHKSIIKLNKGEALSKIDIKRHKDLGEKDIPNNTITKRYETLEKAINSIEQSSNPGYSTLAKFFNSIKTVWKDVDMSIDTSMSQAGSFNNKTRKILINPTRFSEGNHSVTGFEGTILHELLHVPTSEVLKNPNDERWTPKQKKAIKNLQVIQQRVINDINEGKLEDQGFFKAELDEFNVLFNQFKDNNNSLGNTGSTRLRELSKYYAFSTRNTSEGKWNMVQELVTEGLTKPEIQNLLNNIQRDSNMTLLDRFVELITDIIKEFKVVFNGKEMSVNENSLLEETLANTIVIADSNLNKEAKKGSFFKGKATGKNPDLSLGEVDLSIGGQQQEENTRLIDSLDSRIQATNRSITRAKVAKNEGRVKELEAQLRKLEARKEQLVEENVMGTVLNIGNTELDEVRRMLDMPFLSISDLEYINSTLSVWIGADEFFATKEERAEGGAIVDALSALVGRAKALKTRSIDISRDKLLEDLQKDTVRELQPELLESAVEIGSTTSLFMDASRTGNELLSLLSKDIRRQNRKTNKAATEVANKTDKLFEEVRKSPLFKKEGMGAFDQKLENGEITGDNISEIKPEFFIERNKLREKALNSTGKNRAKYWKAYMKWKRENNTIFDSRKLYTSTEDGYVKKENAGYIQQLYREVGDKEAVNNALEKLDRLITQYNVELEAEKIRVQDSERPEIELAQWKQKNNPTTYLQGIVDDNYSANFVSGKFIANEGWKYSVEIPKSKWKDKRFEAIKKDPAMFAFYRHSIDTFNDLYDALPPEMKTGIHFNTRPSLPKSLVEKYTAKGMGGAVEGLGDWFRELITVDDYDEKAGKVVDDVTGQLKRSLSVRFLSPISPDEKSNDLVKIIKLFAHSALAYKYNAEIEDKVRLTQSVINTMTERNVTSSGEPIPDRRGNPVQTEGLVELKKLADYTIETFYGGGKAIEGKVDKLKVETKADKAKKTALQAKIDKTTDEDRKAKLQKELDQIGRKVALSKVGDSLLGLVQLKGMGWNVMAGSVNVTFGTMSNFVWASGKEEFDSKSLLKAIKVMSSVLPGSVSSNKTARKVEALMEKLDVLKQINETISRKNESKLSKGFGKLSPFEANRATEYMAQGQVMVAMLMHQKVKDIKGNERPMWEAYNEDGSWNVKEFGENIKFANSSNNELRNRELTVDEGEFNFELALTQTNKAIHGNYDNMSRVRFKKHFIGRALMQFRSWITEGVANRLESQDYDTFLGRERKGRWRTYYDLGPIKAVKTLLKQMIRSKTAFNELNPIDVANMRKNLTELYQLLGLVGAYYLLKGLVLDDDDDEGRFAVVLILNQLNRLQSDILFYSSPSAFESITRSAMPIFNLFIGGERVLDAVVDTINGEGTYQGGVNHGRNKILWNLGRETPFIQQGTKIIQAGSTVYGDL